MIVVLAVVAAVLVGVGSHPALAAPETMAHTAAAGPPVEPGFPIDFVGVQWQGDHGEGSIRFRRDGRWSAWQALREDGIEVPGHFASGLASGRDAEAYQVIAPPDVGRPRAVAINTTDGPQRAAGVAMDAASAATPVVSRAGWGADESLRFDDAGNEIWPPAYYPAQKHTVHHTATDNDDPDPPATVRAIYRYHAVDRGFGDIGYQYLVDEGGQVYEGRWSGDDGDPGHDPEGKVVTAAHVGGYNSGNVGVALLGTLTDVGPTLEAEVALEDLLGELATRHGIDPEGSSTYVNPVNGSTWTGPNIPGHRDFAATECPGGMLYELLPTVRSNVAKRVGSGAGDVSAPVLSNVRAERVRSTSTWIRWSTDEAATSQVEYWKAGSPTVITTNLDTRLVKAHDVFLSGLSKRTKYEYRVRSGDAAGNVSVSTTGSFTTRR